MKKRRLQDLSLEELEALRLESFDRWFWLKRGDKYGKMIHDFCEAEIERKKEEEKTKGGSNRLGFSDKQWEQIRAAHKLAKRGHKPPA